MDSDTQVYCTHCKHLRYDLWGSVICDFELSCDIWDAEDSRPFSERPFYEERVGAI